MKKLILISISLKLFASATEIPLVEDLSLDQKIGQLIMAATVSDHALNNSFKKESPYNLKPGHIDTLIEKHHIGGILFLGTGTPDAQKKETARLQHLSRLPLLVGLDAEWGLSMRHQADDLLTFPRAMTLGALHKNDEQLIYDVGHEIGRQCKALGTHINFAPVADVNCNPRNPIINTRSFGQDPDNVARKAALYAQGVQDAGICACAKHFPGHGDTDIDTHHKRGIIPHDSKRLHQVELKPFVQLINHKIAAIMTAHLDVPALSKGQCIPATLSHEIVTNLARKKLGFKGLMVTDGLGMKGVTHDYASGQLELMALKAGIDMLVAPIDVPYVITSIKQAIHDGCLTEAQLDAKVARVLHTKRMVACNVAEQHLSLNTQYGRALKRKVYRAAITIARDKYTCVPCTDNELQVVTFGPGDTFLNTLKAARHVHHIRVSTSDELATICTEDKPTVISLHVNNRSGMIECSDDQIDISNLCAQLNKPDAHYIVVLFGNPYLLKHLNQVPTIIVGYENQPEAQEGAAEVILGVQKATGQLPITPEGW